MLNCGAFRFVVVPVTTALRRWSMGTCAFWHEKEGWGAVAVPGRPGVGFTHFSQVEGEGYRYLVAGERVEVVWGNDCGHDGCDWAVASVRPDRTSA